MTVKPFYNEEAVTVDGETYRLVINFRAIDATEAVAACDYDAILRKMTDPRRGVSLALQAQVVWGMLREHHPDLTLDHAMTLTQGTAGQMVGIAVAKLIQAAFPAENSQQKAKGSNPPKRRGASKPS